MSAAVKIKRTASGDDLTAAEHIVKNYNFVAFDYGLSTAYR
jgi:hypothetical protein